jgi:thioredoxin-related protein
LVCIKNKNSQNNEKQALKKIIIIFLSCMLLLPSFGSFLVYTSFKLNQEEISKTICVQRKMVFNSCNGRCELQKSLKKYSDNEKRMQDNLKEKAEIVYIQNTNTSDFTLLIPIKSESKNFAYFNRKPISVSNLTFHPPSCFI